MHVPISCKMFATASFSFPWMMRRKHSAPSRNISALHFLPIATARVPIISWMSATCLLLGSRSRRNFRACSQDFLALPRQLPVWCKKAMLNSVFATKQTRPSAFCCTFKRLTKYSIALLLSPFNKWAHPITWSKEADFSFLYGNVDDKKIFQETSCSNTSHWLVVLQKYWALIQ